MSRWWRCAAPLAAAGALALVWPHASGAGSWPGYLGGPEHSSVASSGQITKAGTAHLTVAWQFSPPKNGSSSSKGFFASPVVDDGRVYIAAKNGDFYALDEATGAPLWKHFTGVRPTLTCGAQGPVATAAVAHVSDGTGGTKPIVYLPAVDGYLYAFDGLTGAVLWRSVIAIPSDTISDYFQWASATLRGGRIYVGVASHCDNPWVRGGLLEFSQATGARLAEYWGVPEGDIGGGVWTSAAATADGVYVSTASGPFHTPGDSFSIVRLDPVTLAKTAIWTVPPKDHTADADFGSSPILFDAELGGGAPTQVVGACNKNGVFYALRTDDFSAPLWTARIGVAATNGGQTCLAGGIYDGSRLFVAGPETTIGGVDYQGSIRRVDPATGAFVWETGLPANVLGSAALNGAGVIAAASYDNIPPELTDPAVLVDADTGAILEELDVGGREFAQPVFADDFLFLATLQTLYAYAPPPLPFGDGFEGGDLTWWDTTGNAAVRADDAKSGTHSALLQSGGRRSYLSRHFSPAVGEIYYHVQFKTLRRGDNSLDLLRVRTSDGAPVATVYITKLGQIAYRNEQTGHSSTGTIEPADRHWHDLLFHLHLAGASSHADVDLDGARAVSRDEAYDTPTVGQLQLGDSAPRKKFSVEFDDVAATVEGGSPQ